MKVEVEEAVWDGITHYLRTLHQQKAIDDVKMKFAAGYLPIEQLLTLWGIEPHPGPILSTVHRCAVEWGERCPECGELNMPF